MKIKLGAKAPKIKLGALAPKITLNKAYPAIAKAVNTGVKSTKGKK